MRLAEILGEGRDDARYRELARSITDFFMDHVAGTEPDAVTETQYGISALYRLAKMGIPPPGAAEQLQRLVFALTATADATLAGARFKRIRNMDMVEVFRIVQNVHTPEDWRSIVNRQAVSMVTSQRTRIEHELIHCFDQRRFKDPSRFGVSYDANRVRIGDPEELRKYYNDPVESNAQLQERFAKWERLVMNRVASGGRAEDVIGSSPRQFFEKFWIWLTPEVRRFIDGDTKRRMIKRSLQLYSDIKTRFPG